MGLELWLVRHGETTASREGFLAGWADVPLTSLGEEQAQSLAPVLVGQNFSGAWSSDLQRAANTALHAWAAVPPDERLREVSFGTLEGLPWPSVDPVYRQMLVDFDRLAFPGGENATELAARLDGFVAELGEGRHLIFTHGGVIRYFTRQVGFDDFVPTATIIGINWNERRLLFRHDCPIQAQLPFARSE